jgi:uncharacterized protein involved in exopolysaccharide biosynthesis/Mrp family chromosome partitioning ATPase
VFWRNEQQSSGLVPSDTATYAASPAESPANRLSVGDVYYILFLHKWKILSLILLGILGAISVVFIQPPVYRSEAKLFIRYVVDRPSISPVGAGSQIKSVDARGTDILASEAEILTSGDLAEEVAKTIGAEKILEKLGGGEELNKAAAIIRRNLTAEVPRSGTVIRVSFRHPDPLIVKPVLNHLIQGYLKKHAEVRRGWGLMDEFITRQTDQVRSQLAQTEEELQKVKTKAVVISLDETKRAYGDQLVEIRRDLLKAEAQLAENKARLMEIQKGVPSAVVQTNAEPGVPAEIIQEHRSLSGQLDTLRDENIRLLVSYTDENVLVKGLRQRIGELEQKKKELEQEYPRLLVTAVSYSSGATTLLHDPAAIETEIAAIQAKVTYLSNQLETIRTEAAGVEKIEPEITRLQRQKDLQETNYRYFQANLEQKRFEEALGAGKDSSIYVVQTPTPPAIDSSTTAKFVGGSLAGGLLGAIGLAFFIELVLDRRVKRAADVVTKLRLPLLLNIPHLKLNGRPRRRALPQFASSEDGDDEPASVATENSPTPAPQLPAFAPGDGRRFETPDTANRAELRTSQMPGDDAGEARVAFGQLFKRKSKKVLVAENGEPDENWSSDAPASDSDEPSVPPLHWQANSRLQPYHDALRDRIILHFETRNLKQKPKLVAVTSCGPKAGVSSLATGVAAALSETGDGKVLLVDMKLEKGTAHPFYDGKPVVGMSEALDPAKRGSGFVQSNLCLATANEAGAGQTELPGIIPRRFARLVPKLKASDFDYIIFDMPPVDQTSNTRRLSSLMDLVVMVLESEKTGLDAARQAHSLLTEVKANVAVVLNKTRKHVPAWLNSEL